MTDVIVNKVESIQRCVKRAREEHAASGGFAHDYTHQDAATLNVIRACEQSIDLANHIIRNRKLGIPKDSAQTFDLLAAAGSIDEELASRLKKMVGFRNTVIHEYQDVDVAIVEAVIERRLDDLITFTENVLAGEVEDEL